MAEIIPPRLSEVAKSESPTEALDLLRDIQVSLQQIADGHVVPHEEAKRRILAALLKP